MQRLKFGQHLVDTARLHMPEYLIVYLYHRSQRTTAQTGYLLYRILLVVCRNGILTDVQFAAESIIDDIGALHMAGCSTAHADGVPPVGHHPELRIERRHRNGLCAVYLRRLIDAFQGIGRQVAELRL